jgi:hypothetical protein
MAQDFLEILNSSQVTDTGSGPHRGDLTAQGHIAEGEYNRSFAIGSRQMSMVRVDKTPFMILSQAFSRLPTDDPEFKSFEEFEHHHRRYAILVGQTNTVTTNDMANNAWTSTKWNNWVSNGVITGLKFGGDYSFGGKFTIPGRPMLGADKTAPIFLTPNQMIKLPVCYTKNSDSDKVAANDFVLLLVTAVNRSTDPAEADRFLYVDAEIIYAPQWTLGASDVVYYGLGVPGYTVPNQVTNGGTTMKGRNLATALATGMEARREDRVYVIGNAHPTNSGLPGNTYRRETITDKGYTQIFKQDIAMDYTTMATVYKRDPNAWKKFYVEMLDAHKQDINRTGIWSRLHKSYDSQNRVRRITQGMIPFILDRGWVFDFKESDNIDVFSEQMSEFNHPDNGNHGGKIVYHCSTHFHLWLNKLSTGGLIPNTILNSSNNPMYSANFMLEGRSNFLGLDITKIVHTSGSIPTVKDVSLDGTGINMVAVNYSRMNVRPLQGNGINRDTTLYTKVQDLSNNGVDARVDLYQSELGFDFWEPTSWAIWKRVAG